MQKNKSPHIILYFQGVFLLIWRLMGETENGVFVELEFLDTFLLFGQVKEQDSYHIDALIQVYEQYSPDNLTLANSHIDCDEWIIRVFLCKLSGLHCTCIY